MSAPAGGAATGRGGLRVVSWWASTAAFLTLVVLDSGGGGSHLPPDRSQAIRDALSLRHEGTADLAPRFVQSWRRRDATIEKVSFRGRGGQTIPALVAYSDLAALHPLPIILCMPGSPNRKEDLIHPVNLLTTWAQAGFFVVSIDRPYHGGRPGDRETAIRTKGLPRVLGEYVDDLIRALDYAVTRPEADPARIGMLGLSMGGMEALLLAAVDERVDCVVSVSGQLSWTDVFAGDGWKLIFTGLPLTRRLRAQGAGPDRVRRAFLDQRPELAILDAPVIAAALAPRPLLLMTGARDPYVEPAATRRTYAAAAVAYGAAADTALALWVDPDVGHAFSRAMAARALAWFERWLGDGVSPPAP